MARFFEVRDHYTGHGVLLALDDVKSVAIAHRPSQTIIRHKSGGYTISDDGYPLVCQVIREAELQT